MKIPSHSHRCRSFFSRHLNSTWRLALIGSIVFGLAVMVGYTATAKAPTLLKSTVGGSVLQAPFVAPVPSHPMEWLLRVSNVFAAEVFTDKPNYQPGETALITGSGFWPNEVITLQIVHIDDTEPGGGGHEEWSVTADSLGNFTSTWFVDPDDSAGSMFRLTARGNSSGLLAETVFTDGSANLDTCANGPVNAPVACAGASWENGNLNGSKSHYFEGDSVPYRTVFENLIPGNTYTITIEYDTTQGGLHALDYLTSYDATETVLMGNDPCTQKQGGSIVTICTGPAVTTPIPIDPRVTAGPNGVIDALDDITQAPGVFTLFNGNALSVVNPGSAYTLDGTYAGNSSTSITVQFNATAATAVLAWAGHISTRLNWGVANSSIAINGSPYHMRLTDITCSDAGEQCNVGQQDHQLSADAVFFPAQLTIIKETNPDDAPVKTFNYTTTGTNLGPFSLTPANGMTPAQMVFNLNDTTARSVTESDPQAAPPEFNLTALSCTQTDGGLGVGTFSTNLGTRTVNFTPKEGQFISCTFVNTEDQTKTRGTIIVDKVTNPGADPTSFDFTTTYGSPFSLTDAATPNNSGLIVPGTYSVTETANSAYVTTATCTSSLGHPADDPSSISLAAGETVTCTFTNAKKPKLTVTKIVVNDNGGTKQISDFPLFVDGNSVTSGVKNTSTVGAHTVSETTDPGYAATIGGDCAADGSITLAAGDDKTCTITNDDIAPKLIVIKHVINDNGGTAVASDFTMTVDDPGTNPPSFPGAEAPGTEVIVDPGAYSVSESGPSGYAQTNSADCSGSIAIGETKTCTVTNNDIAPKLIVIKHVINDNGGTAVASDFTMTVDDPGTNPPSFPGAEAPGTEVIVDPGAYSVSETGPSGYAQTNSADCSGSIAIGETKTCTVTNNDIAPKLIVIKHVINDNGGTAVASDFTMTVDDPGTNPPSFPGAEAPGTEVIVDPGAYSVSESGPSGYAQTNSADCSGSIAIGETKTCTVTNNDIAPKLIVIKHVINDNGGTAVASNFTMTVDDPGTNPASFPGAEAPGTEVIVDPGAYSVSETGPSGYAQTNSADCSGSIAIGETKTCTVTNNDIAAKLIVIKHVINDNGGTAVAGNFTMTVDDPGTNPASFPGAEAPGTQVIVDPGAYSVSETGPNGYAASFSAYCSGSIAIGETKTCTVTNNDISPTLRVIKDVVPDTDGGLFNLRIDGATAGTGANVGDNGTTGFVAVNAGNHTVSETAGTGTTLSDYVSVTGGDCAANGSVSLALAQNKTCTITNTKKGMAQVVKTVNGAPPSGTQAFTFQLRQNATTVNNGTILESGVANAANSTINFTTKLVPGQTYQICEIVMPGWLSNLGTFVPGSFMPPDGVAPNPNVDNSTLCGDFTVNPGETKVFTVDNTPPPGGRALTIGFWKNWSGTCTGGSQKDTLGMTLLSFPIASGQSTRGVFIGKLYVDNTCLEAVPILDKREIGANGKKMASDPAYNLAAQLLAAKVNLQAGAGVCPPVLNAINQAQALLYSINFTGSGAYLKKMSPAQAALANCLATWLDDYNNNRATACNATRTCP